jgi:peptidoglycan/LPS O-acetylase OafA/YrhL
MASGSIGSTGPIRRADPSDIAIGSGRNTHRFAPSTSGTLARIRPPLFNYQRFTGLNIFPDSHLGIQLLHRNDIDGLRTFAVLPVVAFHFGILHRLTGGGFVGVDIFFVISGYLITRIIYSNINDGTYSISRRMTYFPCIVYCLWFLHRRHIFFSLPSEAKAIGNSIISSIFFISNIFFNSKSGYFDRDVQENPLLHTWSLSVEEQFYVILPIIIYLIRNFNDKTKIRILFTVALSSFFYSVWVVHINSESAFYLVQFRAWELLIGALLAINAVPKLVHQWQAELVGAGDLALIVGSIILISSTTPFPIFAAFAPCLGTAAVIHSGAATTTLTGRLLAFSPNPFHRANFIFALFMALACHRLLPPRRC